MKKTKFIIDVGEICHQLKKVDSNFKKSELPNVTGVTNNTMDGWGLNAPDVISLLHCLSKNLHIGMDDIVSKSNDEFPVIKLLKYFKEKTNLKVDKVINVIH